MQFLRRKLIQYLVRNLLAAIPEEAVLTVSNRGWFLNKRKLSPEEVAHLAETCRSFQESEVWKLVHNEIRYLANLQMFEKGIKEENTVFGRAMLYNLEIMEKFLVMCGRM